MRGEEGCGARTLRWTAILFQLLAVHLQEDVVSDFGPPGAVDPPSAATGAGVGHYGIRQAGGQPG